MPAGNSTGWGRGRRSSHRIGRKYKNERNLRKGRNDDNAEANNEVDEASDDAAEASKDEVSWIPQDLEDVANEIDIQVETESPLQACHQAIIAGRLPERWYMSYAESFELRCFEVVRQEFHKPMSVLRLLLVRSDLTWQVYVADSLVPSDCVVLKDFPTTLSREFVSNVVSRISTAKICAGHYDDKFIALSYTRGGRFLSHSGELVAFLDEAICVEVGGKQYSATIRHVKCELLINGDVTVCVPCNGFRPTLRALLSYHNKQKSIISVHTNVRFLKTTSRKDFCILSLRKALRFKNRQLRRMRMRLNTIVKNDGVVVPDDLRKDIEKVVESQPALGDDEFKRIFWEQQVAAWKANKTGVRWHPLFIRWCLNIMLTSSKTYQIIRESGFISLPSQRTLKDYTHWTKLQPGFNAEMFNHVIKEAKVDEMEEWRRFVVLAIDEMKIRADLVFNKSTGDITGFVDYGEGTLEHQFTELQQRCKQQKLADREVATHMLTVMVRGITFHLNLPIAQFATTGVLAEQIMPIVWRAIRMLQLAGLTVVSVVADGASSNRKFFRLHKISQHQKSGVTHKAPNICRQGHYVYLMPDAPHLLKTVQNAWYNSQANRTRKLINNGHEIKWAHLVELYNKAVADSGLYIGNKLAREHVYLTSYSRMNVRLAAQVLSSSVANGLETMRTLKQSTTDTTETEKFCRMFDKFFDIFNTRSLDEHMIKKKPNLCPFYKGDNERLKWLEETLLKYLEDWQKWVDNNSEIPDDAKRYCVLPDQTVEGIKICVHSLNDLVPFLLSHEGIEYILTERFNQDSLEGFFGKQRLRGCRNDNPSVNQFLENTQAIVVQKSLAYGGSSNIAKKRKSTVSLSPLSRPLPKRRRTKLMQ